MEERAERNQNHAWRARAEPLTSPLGDCSSRVRKMLDKYQSDPKGRTPQP